METTSAAYSLEPWHDLFVMSGGAAGALVGLLFVAVSINLDRILTTTGLSRRAAETIVILVVVLLTSAFALVPQAVTAMGWETVVLGLVLLALVVGRLRMPLGPSGTVRTVRVNPAVILALAGLPTAIGGLSIIAGTGGGIYWLVATVALGFAGGIGNAWVLLVEILR